MGAGFSNSNSRGSTTDLSWPLRLSGIKVVAHIHIYRQTFVHIRVKKKKSLKNIVPLKLLSSLKKKKKRQPKVVAHTT